MKTILLTCLTLMGAALLASAGEQTKKNQTQEFTTALTGNAAAATNAPDEKIGEKVARPEGITLKALRTTGQTAAALLNPLAPLEQAPATPWLKRAAWNTAADRAVARPGPIETRHESQLSVVIWRQY